MSTRQIHGVIFDSGGVLTGSSSSIFRKNVSRALSVSWLRLYPVIEAEKACLMRGEETSLDFWKNICHRLNINSPPTRVLKKLWIDGYARNTRINARMFR